MSTVSLSALKRLVHGPREETKRFNDIAFGQTAKYKKAVRIDPVYEPKSRYDIHGVRYGSVEGPFFKKVYDVWEYYEPIQLASWDAYITSAFLQTRPDRFLEYMRLIESAGPNPYVSWTGKKYVDTLTGDSRDGTASPHPAMYPHTYKGEKPDYSITADRFRETVISYALGEAYTILDIAKTTDPQFLEWAYKRVINRLPEVKTWINESSVVSLIQRGTIRKKETRSLPREIRSVFNKAADDALVIIRQNQDKLAARAIETRELKTKAVEPSFVGPEWLNPLASANITEAEIAKEIAKRSVIRPSLNYEFSVPSIPKPKITSGALPPAKKRGNALVPIAVGAAAVGLVTALT